MSEMILITDDRPRLQITVDSSSLSSDSFVSLLSSLGGMSAARYFESKVSAGSSGAGSSTASSLAASSRAGSSLPSLENMIDHALEIIALQSSGSNSPNSTPGADNNSGSSYTDIHFVPTFPQNAHQRRRSFWRIQQPPPLPEHIPSRSPSPPSPHPSARSASSVQKHFQPSTSSAGAGDHRFLGDINSQRDDDPSEGISKRLQPPSAPSRKLSD